MSGTSIKRLHVEPLNSALEEPFVIAIGAIHQIENVLIAIELENGVVGYGEASPLPPINGENQATVQATLHACETYLLGKDVGAYRTVAAEMKATFSVQATARCAIEMAMLDAFTKNMGLPLFRYFGGAGNQIETDFTIGLGSTVRAGEAAKELAARGYRVIKTKVGHGLAEDIERMVAIRDGAPACRLTIDANQGFTAKEALEFLEALERHGIRPVLFEQPVARHDLVGMKFVRDRTNVPIAADETVFTAADAIRVVRAECADIINVKIMKSGLVEALDIVTIARAAGLRLMIGCMLESRLGMSASAHLAAGLGCFDYIDLDPHGDPDAEAFTGGPDFLEPIYHLRDDSPGLGMLRKPKSAG